MSPDPSSTTDTGRGTGAPVETEILHVPAAREVTTLAEDVLHGFAQDPPSLPPKYFYDEHGSALFDRICDTPEYYPTRTEAQLLEAHADAIVEAARPEHILELGAGTARKTETLLAACERAGLAPTYWPFDVCEGVVRDAAARLRARFPWLRVKGLIGDYTAGLDHLPRPDGRCLYMFLGGTLGNFDPPEGQALLGEVAAMMGAADRFLLGVDRVKDRATLEAAYDDAAGVTAAFNRNVLRVINRELGADFSLEAFEHRSVFDPDNSRIEMHLCPRSDQSVHVAALERTYRFAAGQCLRTEISRKFTPESLAAELRGGGLASVEDFLAPRDYFSLTLAAPGR